MGARTRDSELRDFHLFATVTRGFCFVVLDPGNRQPHATHCAPIVGLYLPQVGLSGLGWNRTGQQPDHPNPGTQNGCPHHYGNQDVQGLQPLDDQSVGHAAAFAHCLEAVPATGPLQLVNQSGEQLGTGRTQRMTERHGAAVDIDL